MPFVHCTVESKNFTHQERMIYSCGNQAGLILQAFHYFVLNYNLSVFLILKFARL